MYRSVVKQQLTLLTAWHATKLNHSPKSKKKSQAWCMKTPQNKQNPICRRSTRFYGNSFRITSFHTRHEAGSPPLDVSVFQQGDTPSRWQLPARFFLRKQSSSSHRDDAFHPLRKENNSINKSRVNNMNINNVNLELMLPVVGNFSGIKSSTDLWIGKILHYRF